MASGVEPVTGTAYPQDGDFVTLPSDLTAITLGLGAHTVGRYDNTTDRNAAIDDPGRGQLAAVSASNGSTLQLHGYDGSGWDLLAFSPSIQEVTASAASSSIPDGQWTTIAVGAVVVNNIGADITSDGTSPVIQTDGIYEIQMFAMFSANNDAKRRIIGWSTTIGSQADGGPPANQQGQSSSVNSTLTYVNKYDVRFLTAGQRVCMRAFQDSGATLTISTRRIWVRRVG